MTMLDQPAIGYDDGDIDTNVSTNGHINDLIALRYSRRQTLRGGLSAMSMAVFGGAMLAGCDQDDTRRATTVTAGDATSTTSGKTVTLVGTVTSGTRVSNFMYSLQKVSTSSAVGSLLWIIMPSVPALM